MEPDNSPRMHALWLGRLMIACGWTKWESYVLCSIRLLSFDYAAITLLRLQIARAVLTIAVWRSGQTAQMEALKP